MRGSLLDFPWDPAHLLQALDRRFFDHVEIDERWVQIVRDASTRGPVVYVLRALSVLDFIALDYLTKARDLPRLGFANDLGFDPFARNWLQMLRTSPLPPEQRLAQVIQSGGSAALFLKRSPTVLEKAVLRGRRRISTEGDSLVRTLIELQRKLDRPIMLVPQVFVWSKRPVSIKPSASDLFLGHTEWPGALRTAMQFLVNYRHVMLRAGEPVSLQDFLKANAGESDDTLVRRGTYALLRKLERERRTILGPLRKPADRVRDEIIRSPKLQHAIVHLAGEGRSERMLLTARAYRMLRDMEAMPDPETVVALTTAFQGVLGRIYAGVEVDKAGLERVRQASHTGTLVLLPSHKSHMDYLLLSYILYRNALQLPLIAAGDNLSFFPAGFLFRRGGAFFIRRSFKGDRLYVAVVDAYLRRMLRDGWPVEFFLEGGRSRTGKLLPPMLGLLNMLVDAAMGIPDRDVHFVPVSIGYERLVEERSYMRELLGADKHKESTSGLIRALGVLAERYGRINLQFGEIMSLRQTASECGVKPGAEPTPSQRREITKRIAYQTMANINAATAATPGAVVAMALLTHARRGVSHTELMTRVRALVTQLQRLGARMTPSLVGPSGSLQPGCVTEATEMFRQAGLLEVHVAGESLHGEAKHMAQPADGNDIIYSIPENKRLMLDMSKNIIVHFFVPAALVASAIIARPGPGMHLDVLRERVQRLSRLFKFEFMFRVDRSFDQLFDEALAQMIAQQEVVQEDDQLSFGQGHDGIDGRGWVVMYASMLRNFLESYRLAARGLTLLVKGPMPERDLARRTLAIGDRMYLAGDIERREALSRPCLDNAFQALLDQGYVRTEEGHKLALAASFSDPDAVRAIEARIANYLPRRSDDRT